MVRNTKLETITALLAGRTDYRRVRFRKVKVPSTLRRKATLLISQWSRGGTKNRKIL